MSALIPGPDDAFIQTWSASGQFGSNIDRFLTREIHTRIGLLGKRDYFDWDGDDHVSQEGFEQCSKHVLIDGDKSTCGTRLWGPPLGAFFSPVINAATSPDTNSIAVSASTSDGVTSNPRLEQLSRLGQGTIRAGEHLVRKLSIEGGPTAFSASWASGTVAFKLVDPTGKVIDPAYVASIQLDPSVSGAVDVTQPLPDMVIYQASATGGTYYFPAARTGSWQVVLDGGHDLPNSGIQFTTAASFDSQLAAEFASDHLSYAPEGVAHFTVKLSQPTLRTSAQIAIHRPDGKTDIINMAPSGSQFAAAYNVPNVPGYTVLEWAITGTTLQGTAFERGGRAHLAIGSTALHLGNGHSDHPIPRTDIGGLNAALAVQLHVVSAYSGANLGVAGDLVASNGTVIAHGLASTPAVMGDNDVQLLFRADDIYRGLLDGPYTVQNVRLIDEQSAPLLSQTINVAYTTRFYSFRSFAPTPGTPSVFLEGPYSVEASKVLTLTATGADPESDPLTYAWDLDGNGTFETPGQSVTFNASKTTPVGMHTVSVKVTDTTGRFAISTTQVEVLVPHIANLARTADAYAKSSLRDHPVSLIKDGDQGQGKGAHFSWLNGLVEKCRDDDDSFDDQIGRHKQERNHDGGDNDKCEARHEVPDLPAWVELEFPQLSTLKRVELYMPKDQPIRDYDVQVQQGADWITIAEVRNNSAPHRTHTLNDVVGTSIRVVGFKGTHTHPGVISISELEVYGY